MTAAHELGYPKNTCLEDDDVHKDHDVANGVENLSRKKQHTSLKAHYMAATIGAGPSNVDSFTMSSGTCPEKIINDARQQTI